MNIHDATEQAYKNGYRQGKQDAVKHGRWEERMYSELIEETGEYWEDVYYYCTNCDAPNFTDEAPYCPNCGAKMDLEE